MLLEWYSPSQPTFEWAGQTGATLATIAQGSTSGVADFLVPPGGASVWGSITGLLADQADLTAALAGKATAAQGGLADSALQPGDPLPWADITGKPLTFAPAAHSHTIADTAGLQAAIDGKQPLATALTNTTAAFTTTQEAKLAGIAPGATANSSDAVLLARANHTGTQASATISDFAEAVDDRVAALLVAGGNMTLTYDDVAGTLVLDASGGGGGLAGAVVLSFGAAPGGSYVEQVVIDAGIDATKRVKVWVQGSTADHNAVEHAIIAGEMGLSVVPTAGQFTIYANSNLRLTGSVALVWEAA